MRRSFTVLILLTSLVTYAQKKEAAIKIISTSDGLFHFKLTKKLQNGAVEVLDASNRPIRKQSLDCKRMIIDFYDASPGTYQIRISATNFKQIYTYVLMEEKGYMKVTTEPAQPENLYFERYTLNKAK